MFDNSQKSENYLLNHILFCKNVKLANMVLKITYVSKSVALDQLFYYFMDKDC